MKSEVTKAVGVGFWDLVVFLNVGLWMFALISIGFQLVAREEIKTKQHKVFEQQVQVRTVHPGVIYTNDTKNAMHIFACANLAIEIPHDKEKAKVTLRKVVGRSNCTIEGRGSLRNGARYTAWVLRAHNKRQISRNHILEASELIIYNNIALYDNRNPFFDAPVAIAGCIPVRTIRKMLEK